MRMHKSQWKRLRQLVKKHLMCWGTLFLTGVDNRVLGPLFGFHLRRYKKRNCSPAITKPKMRFNGMVSDYGYSMQCEKLFVDFDLCKKNYCGKRSQLCCFEEGFMRIGDMVSPFAEGDLPLLDFDNWKSVKAQPPFIADVAHRQPALFIDARRSIENIAILLRHVTYYLHVLVEMNIRISDVILLVCDNEPEIKLDAFMSNLFNVKRVKDMHGVHLFHNAIYLPFIKNKSKILNRAQLAARLQTREAFELTCRYVLKSFGITPRHRSDSVNKITLISRHNYEKPFSSNLVARRISNEDEIVMALRKGFSDAEVNKVKLEEMSVADQLRLIVETDILIGMHGAAFGWSIFLTPNAGMLELFPRHFLYPHYFNVFYCTAVNKEIHYRRWINFILKREFASKEWEELRSNQRMRYPNELQRDFTEVPSQAVLRQAKALQRQMRKAVN